MDYWEWVLDYNSSIRDSDGRYLTDVFTEEAVAFIHRHAREPFFLYTAYNAPHMPLQAPPETVARYAGREGLNPAVSTLYAMIERMDTGIGRILEVLERDGIAQNTLVIFTSDNGPWLADASIDGERHSLKRWNGPFRGMKQDVLEGGIRVPAIVRWPDHLPAGSRSNAFIHFTDWLPTVLQAAGVKTPPDLRLDGQNVLPVLRGEEEWNNNRVAFWQWNRYAPIRHCNAAMREGDWKLVWPSIPAYLKKEAVDNEWAVRAMTQANMLMDIDATLPVRKIQDIPAPVLFDLATDPEEINDLTAIHPERVCRMKARWDAWFDEIFLEWERAFQKNTEKK